jgi:hypothetical protein
MSRARRRDALVQQLIDPAQYPAQGPRVTAGPAQIQRGLELDSDEIRYRCSGSRCVALQPAALHFARGPINEAKCAR